MHDKSVRFKFCINFVKITNKSNIPSSRLGAEQLERQELMTIPPARAAHKTKQQKHKNKNKNKKQKNKYA